MPDGDDRPPHLETTAVTAGRSHSGDSLAPLLFPSTTYEVGAVAEHAEMVRASRPDKLYSRFGSPTVRELEEAVAELEGAEAALASASGMATISAVLLGLCSAGDHVVATRQVFSVTYALLAFHLPRFGIDVTFVDGTDADALAAAVIPGKTQVVLAETPANPALSLVDLDALAAIQGPFTVVDSTLPDSTPRRLTSPFTVVAVRSPRKPSTRTASLTDASSPLPSPPDRDTEPWTEFSSTTPRPPLAETSPFTV